MDCYDGCHSLVYNKPGAISDLVNLQKLLVTKPEPTHPFSPKQVEVSNHLFFVIICHAVIQDMQDAACIMGKGSRILETILA
jgi:hypothetical protein